MDQTSLLKKCQYMWHFSALLVMWESENGDSSGKEERGWRERGEGKGKEENKVELS